MSKHTSETRVSYRSAMFICVCVGTQAYVVSYPGKSTGSSLYTVTVA